MSEQPLLRDRYEPLETIGRGGQGEVLKARDHFHDRLVAIKVRDMPAPEDRDSFLQEARVLLNLEPHPGFPIIRDDFFEGDRYYLVMDWVEGIDLATLLQQRGDPGLPYAIVLRYIEQVAQTLDHLHAHDPPVVHQDIKPANLILTPKQRVVLVDFGIAGSVAGRNVMGTPHFVAPEVLAGDLPTPAADVYGLAATSFTLLTGAPPRGDATDWQDVPRENVEIVKHALGRGLATDPAARPGSAEELVERLRARLEAGTTTDLGPRPIPAKTPTRPARRGSRRRIAWSLAVVAVATVMVAAWVVLRAPEPATARPPVNSVALIDTSTGTLTDWVKVGEMPSSIVTVDGSAWVANHTDETVTRIDTETGEAVRTITSNGHPTDMSATQEELWLTNELEGTVVRIDLATDKVTNTLQLPTGTKNVAATDEGIWVTHAFDRTLSRIDPRTSTVTSTVQLPGIPADVVVAFGSVWVTEPATKRLLQIDPETIDASGPAQITSIAMRGEPEQIAIGDEELWITSPLTNQVFRVDPAARSVTAIDVGNSPTGVAWDGSDVWVANYLDGTVTRIDGETSRVVETIRVGNAPEALAAADGRVWVTVHAR